MSALAAAFRQARWRCGAGDAILMAIDSNTTGQPGRKSPRFGIGRFLFVVILVVLFLLLGRAWCGIASFEVAGLSERLNPTIEPAEKVLR